ncbi:alpha/beta hydrolase [Asanoa iriomotensis]|uniref:Alpha/beta hydrolase n=1 Tax=Asanoa iriomotensis TaxID=234613 RepID=A0ABQ4CD58_9ACTN|nr:alpha/beta hydrolase [Asanoa iriomotensis]
MPGGYLHYQVRGAGPDVVLFNGATADLRMWESTLDWLAGVARVTMFDCRDTGLSSPGTAPYSEVDDVAAVFDAAGVTDAVLVGSSEGARRALAFAHQHAARVRRVVAVSGAFGEFPDPTPEEAAARQEMHAVFAKIDHALETDGVRAAAEIDIDVWAPALDAYHRRKLVGLQVANAHRITLAHYHGRELDPPVKTRFHEITVSVTAVVGGREFAGSRLWAERIVRQAPHATLTVIPEADHFAMLSAPEQFERVLREALTS